MAEHGGNSGTTVCRNASTFSFLSESSPQKNMCPHPGVYAGMCMRCGQEMDDEFGVAFGYIHKKLRLANDEISRLRGKDLKNLLRRRKLYLILDLDHTLLHSARLPDFTVEEGYLHGQRDSLPDNLKSSLFRVEWMQTMTKLRPFVHTFLKEASICLRCTYTLWAIAHRSIKRALMSFWGKESAVLILDDTEAVWGKHKENLILMERYHFFASSCKHFGFNYKSLSERKSDESKTEGALATVLKILQRIHSLFFDEWREDNLEDRDVRQVLKAVRKEVLKDCKVVFSRVFPTNFPAEHHTLWKMAEQLGATCSL
ncbi:hypothetical protein DH2020_041030 [Rehmannia glutinosa]|uniref:protein-serine/threonine phosphatase n=1 Tax=Rehmannia glutinosa TaxID=99300 RepID=A0ABR0USX4_REHGL